MEENTIYQNMHISNGNRYIFPFMSIFPYDLFSSYLTMIITVGVLYDYNKRDLLTVWTRVTTHVFLEGPCFIYFQFSVFLFCLCLFCVLYPELPLSLGGPFLILPSVFSNVYFLLINPFNSLLFVLSLVLVTVTRFWHQRFHWSV